MWVSVNERLPKKADATHFDEVLACNRDTNDYWIASYDGGGDPDFAWAETTECTFITVTHWTRLPELPSYGTGGD